MGLADVSLGHQRCAEHIDEVLSWRAESGITHVTIFVASIDNLSKRAPTEIDFLMRLAERVTPERLAAPSGRWQLHLAGRLDLLADSTARALKQAEEATRDRATGSHVTLAIGYGGRAEIAGAVHSLLHEEARAGTTAGLLARTLTDADIARHLYTTGQPDPDLVIRTSAEQRLSDFLIWQTASSELLVHDRGGKDSASGMFEAYLTEGSGGSTRFVTDKASELVGDTFDGTNYSSIHRLQRLGHRR